ncbi:MAG: hypothetical protein HQL06_11050 [Nitrospirae bacterium]|nr:hypothetical protein [Nitrospirota bacterium]
MPTPQEIRKIRIKNDFDEMKNIQGQLISWQSRKGVAPFIESYELHVKVRTIIEPDPLSYKDEHILHLTIPDGYPLGQAHPEITMVDRYPYHPNWFTDGRWCCGNWDTSEGLGHFVVRMVKTLQFDMEITNELSPANNQARDWYVKMRNSGLFPCDRQTLPDPSYKIGKFIIEERDKLFRIRT